MRFHRTPGQVPDPAPEPGPDTELVLLDLGYTREDILKLREQGATIV